ncbi:MAG: serine hydrolase, partial [Planctomycetaceae bacterium]
MLFRHHRNSWRCFLVLLALLAIEPAAGARETERTQKGLEYANIDGHSLKLDLYLPTTDDPLLVIWIHGGGWQNGSKNRCPIEWLTEHGYAVASIAYRLSSKAIFPAQIQDCKAAVRWLRSQADRYGYRSDRIAVAGGSAGGHLAALLGTTGDVAELEGTVGGNLDQSSRVDAVIDYFGPTDFILRSKTHPERANAPESGTAKLLGGGADQQTELARLASPVTHVTPDDPPMLVLHGDKDKTVYLDQSLRLQEVYRQAGLPLALRIIKGAGHGGNRLFSGPQREPVVDFLDRELRRTHNSAHSLPRSTPESQGVSSAQILKFVDAANSQVHSMHSFMLLRHGQVLSEGWWSPEAADKPHVLWSLSKSFTSTAVGLAVADGKLDINDPVLKFFPEDAPTGPSEHLQAMRVRDLLTMSTGQDPLPILTEKEVWTKTFLAAPVIHKPGTTFLYNTPATYMQSAIVQQVTGDTVVDFLTPRLFEPLGIRRPLWSTSPQEISLGGYGLFLKTEDIAKFGQLYLQRGVWNGRQLIPAEWVEQ